MRFQLFPEGIPPAKRIFDLVFTISGTLLISPLLVIVTLVLLLSEGRPVLFKQERPGYKGRVFKLYKFRTMRNLAGPDGKTLPDAARISKLGRFLRAASIDELPECFNILKGEMSLVGPRPLLVQYLERYTPEQMRRHDVFPGITGWAQVHGRNALTWEEKFRLDVWYVDHYSVWLDFKILAMTALKVFMHEGINQPGEATACEFMGEQKK